MATWVCVKIGYCRGQGEDVIPVRSEMWWFSSPRRSRFSFGNADTGQRSPGWRVARWKGIDQAFKDFVVVGSCDGFTVLQGPGVGPAFSTSMKRCPGRHRLQAVVPTAVGLLAACCRDRSLSENTTSATPKTRA